MARIPCSTKACRHSRCSNSNPILGCTSMLGQLFAMRASKPRHQVSLVVRALSWKTEKKKTNHQLWGTCSGLREVRSIHISRLSNIRVIAPQGKTLSPNIPIYHPLLHPGSSVTQEHCLEIPKDHWYVDTGQRGLNCYTIIFLDLTLHSYVM